MLQSEPYAAHLNWSGQHPDCLTHSTRGIATEIYFILFWISTLRISDGISVHHQESKTRRHMSHRFLPTAC